MLTSRQRNDPSPNFLDRSGMWAANFIDIVGINYLVGLGHELKCSDQRDIPEWKVCKMQVNYY